MKNIDLKSLDFSLNINFLKPNTDVNFDVLDVSFYENDESLKQKIAKNYIIKSSQMELFFCNQSAISSLFRYLNLSYCTIYSPCNLFYKKACVSFGYEIRLINRFENIEFPLKQGSLVVLQNPSYPDGRYYDIEYLLKYWKKQNCTVLIDESFLDFCDGESAIKYIKDYENLYILKSMSYFYSCEGILDSFIISNEKNIEKIKRFEPENKVSSFDSVYLQSCLKDKNFKLMSKVINIRNQIELKKILENCSFIDKVFDTKTNYFLVRLKGIKVENFQKKMDNFSIKVKNCSKFDYLDDYYMGICLKSSKENMILKEVFEEICF